MNIGLNIGLNIKYFREKKGLSIDDLATKLNVSKSTISRYENNKREPNTKTLLRIAEILGIDIGDLLYQKGKTTIASTSNNKISTFDTPKIGNINRDSSLKITRITAELDDVLSKYYTTISPNGSDTIDTEEKEKQLLKKIQDLIEYEIYKEKKSTFEDISTSIAAHDDNLTNGEKDFTQKQKEEFKNNKDK